MKVRMTTGERVPVLDDRAVEHGPVRYNPSRDELVIQASVDTTISVSPGRELVAAIHMVMAQAEEAGSLEPVSLGEQCDACGEKVITSRMLNGTPIVVDAAPSGGGIFLFARRGRMRSLRPFEEPVVPTYRKHRCATGATP